MLLQNFPVWEVKLIDRCSYNSSIDNDRESEACKPEVGLTVQSNTGEKIRKPDMFSIIWIVFKWIEWNERKTHYDYYIIKAVTSGEGAGGGGQH